MGNERQVSLFMKNKKIIYFMLLVLFLSGIMAIGCRVSYVAAFKTAELKMKPYIDSGEGMYLHAKLVLKGCPECEHPCWVFYYTSNRFFGGDVELVVDLFGEIKHVYPGPLPF